MQLLFVSILHASLKFLKKSFFKVVLFALCDPSPIMSQSHGWNRPMKTETTVKRRTWRNWQEIYFSGKRRTLLSAESIQRHSLKHWTSRASLHKHSRHPLQNNSSVPKRANLKKSAKIYETRYKIQSRVLSQWFLCFRFCKFCQRYVNSCRKSVWGKKGGGNTMLRAACLMVKWV